MGIRKSRGLPFWSVLVVLTFVCFVSGVSARDAQDVTPEGGAFFDTVDVEVESVEVFVTDAKGNPITGLGAADFRLRVDGDEVPITNFYAEVSGRSAVSPEPTDRRTTPEVDGFSASRTQAHLVVFVDNSNIAAIRRKKVFKSLRQFLGSGLGPEDLVSVVTLDQGAVNIRSEFLADREALSTVLDEVEKTSGKAPAADRERQLIFSEMTRRTTDKRMGKMIPGSLLARIRLYAQAEFEQGMQTLDILGRYVTSLSGVPGRKVLLYVSDGIADRPGEGLFYSFQLHFGGSDYTKMIGTYDLLPRFKAVMRQATASQVTLYAIDAVGDHGGAVRGAALEGAVSHNTLSVMDTNFREPMEATAVATGGRWIPGAQRLSKDLSRVAVDLGTYYSLGFSPPVAEEGRRYRINIDLAPTSSVAKDAGRLTVRHRTAFERKPRDQRSAQAVVATLLYHTMSDALGARVEPGERRPRENGAAEVPIQVSVPIDRLVLLPQNDSQLTAQVSVFVAVKNRAGEPGPVRKLTFRSMISGGTDPDASARSAELTVPVPVEAEDLQVALVVRDDLGATQSTYRFDL